jgi:hypothetical protein
LNVKTEQKIAIFHVLRRDTSGPAIFNASAITPVIPAIDLSPIGTNPAGIILQNNPVEKQQGIISNGVNKAFIQDLFIYNCSLSHALSPLSYEGVSKSQLQKRRIISDD